MDDVRCPYCVEGDAFKLMAGFDGGRFACGRCGHVVCPESPGFHCPCQKCKEMNRPLLNSSSGRFRTPFYSSGFSKV